MPGVRKVFIMVCWLLAGCNSNDPVPGNFSLVSAFVGPKQLQLASTTTDVAIDQSIALNFSKAIDRSTVGAISLSQGTTVIDAEISFSSEDKTVIIFPKALLQSNSAYSVN